MLTDAAWQQHLALSERACRSFSRSDHDWRMYWLSESAVEHVVALLRPDGQVKEIRLPAAAAERFMFNPDIRNGSAEHLERLWG